MAKKASTEEMQEEVMQEETSEKKVRTPAEDKAYWAELVDFKAFKDSGKYKDDIIVGWNGKFYQIQRGVEVQIPRAVREIIYRSMDQDQRTAEYIEKKQAEFRNESRKYE